MKIALVGGTGDIGRGFAVRWASKHDVILGSRKAEKAQDSAVEVNDYLKSRSVDSVVCGMDNGSAVSKADVVVLCVPFETLDSVTTDLKSSYSTQIVISPIVPMTYKKYFQLVPQSGGSAANLVKERLPSDVLVVSAFHTIPAAALQDLDRALKGDVAVCGDDSKSKGIVFDLVSDIRDLRPLDAGPLAVSSLVEGLTPLLLNVARKNKMKNLGLQFVSES